ncbi:uncharacterized protein LOC128248134 [Octopus bimaculoides]|uniref:uncharacterized protein LOC128248134 n=1 Tax=Octopus bimaculoides TaxID=37653 RepID=UPI0022E5B780|nr:uncharacterized protein LOC128248134 [Octopus bimaculoides]
MCIIAHLLNMELYNLVIFLLFIRYLEDVYKCVLIPNNKCKMPPDWQKNYKQYACENSCYDIKKQNSFSMTDEEKCNELNHHKSELDRANCNIPKDIEKEYKSLKCDIRCNKARQCSITIQDYSTKEICKTLSLQFKCNENAKCPTPQNLRDTYALYGCGTSCNGNVLNECAATLKRLLNSTREELCGYYREEGRCNDKAKCKMEEKYMKLFECSGAANRSTMFAVIFSFLLAVQMLEKYISLS